MQQTSKILFITYLFILLTGSSVDFFDIAWGTGVWLGNFSLTWALLFIFFCLFYLAAFTVLVWIFWQDNIRMSVERRMISFRQKLGWLRPILVLMVFVFPVWFFQFSILGLIFHGFYLRLSLWTFQVFLLSFLATAEDKFFIGWKFFLYSIVITAAFFSVMSSLSHVTGYPFSLGWSEGNRLWDYSILFGRDRYDFPRDKEIAVYLDVGRQIIGGIPFLFPGLTIVMERMWLGLTLILPYILLGLASFRSFFRKKYLWLAMILWTFLFLKQGPIHAPLILCAALVILAWKSRLWFSIPLVIFATYIATVSRYTWVFAPFLWFFMLELFDGLVGGEKRIYLTPRIRSLLFLSTLGVILGFLFFEIGVYFKIDWLLYGYGLFSGLKVSPEFIQEKIQQQPLLWYRLLPNETYGNGILIGLVVAICPLLLVLFYLIKSKVWTPSVLQILTIAFPTLAFFVVGIIVSVKIGGGADLHNMDMFLIALFFIAVIAAHCEIEGWWENNRLGPWWVQSALVMLIAVPAFGPLMEMRSYNFGSAATWLRTLADVRNERSLDMYPADAVISQSLLTIQREVDSAKTSGDILFMDQRQLLTFKFIQNVALVPEYDKKILMEQALRSNQGYFEEFYNNLREKQFALIITQPLNTPQKGGDSQFGEENDAWVKWVSIPLLCFYEVKQTLLDVNVQLLVPRHGSVDCTNILPSEGLN